MTPEKVRSMVTAMQAAGESDDAIKQALDLAKSQEGLTPERRARLQASMARNDAKLAELRAQPVMTAGEFAGETLQNMGALAHRFANGATFGAVDAINKRLFPEQHAYEQEQQKRLNNPVGQFAGGLMDATGGAVGGPGALYSKIAAPLTQAVANPLLQAGLRGGIAGGLTGGLQADVAGAPLKEQAKEAGKSAIVGALMDMLPTSVFQGAQAVLKSPGAQARQRLEARGANVGLTDSGSGGVFDNELAGLPANDRGIGQASRRAAASVLTGMDQDFRENVLMPHVQNKAAIEATLGPGAQGPLGPGHQIRDVTPLYSELVKVYQSERLTPPEQAQVRGILDRLERHIGDQNGQTGIYMTETQLNDFRGMLQDVSKVGSPSQPTVAQAKMQGPAHEAKTLVDQGPYADTNAKFHEGKSAYEDRRQLLDLPAEPANYLDPARRAPEGGSEPEVAKVANMMARDQQNTVTAGIRNADRLQQFSEQNPQYADTLALPKLLEDKANLEFRIGNPKHGGLLNRLKHEGMPMATIFTVADLLSHNPAVSAGLAGASHLINANAAPLAGRVLYTPALNISRMGTPPALPPGQSPPYLSPTGALVAGSLATPSNLDAAYADALARLRQSQSPQENR